jgi:uncharacterized membrane protein YjgN (DUF898 family)
MAGAGPASPGPEGRPSFFRKPSAPPSLTTEIAPPPPPPPRIPPPPPPPPPPVPVGWDPGPPAAGADVNRLSFHGVGGSLFGIHIVNVFLTIVTLGVFYFWGKARVRRYLWSQTAIAGDRFAFHGTGREMFLGFLKAVLIFAVPLIALSIVYNSPSVWGVVRALAYFLAYLIGAVFYPLAIVGARRYRLSRSSWRGIRFSFRGSGKEFIRLFFVQSLLTGVTLGLWYPVFDTKRYAFLTSNSWFGNRRFDFDGSSFQLFKSFLLALILTPFTLGLCWFWYVAKKRRFFWGHTTFGAARYQYAATGGAILLLMLLNLIIIVATLGLGWPWAKVRSARFLARNLTLVGPLELESIQQDAQAASATGEGLAGLLDAGGLDLG